jgi:hypothetical protein
VAIIATQKLSALKKKVSFRSIPHHSCNLLSGQRKSTFLEITHYSKSNSWRRGLWARVCARSFITLSNSKQEERKFGGSSQVALGLEAWIPKSVED